MSSSAISSIMTACTSWIRSRFPSQSGRQKILVRLLVLFALQLTSCPRGCLSALPLLRLSSDLRWAHDGGIIPRDAVTNESVKPGLPFPSFCSSSRLLKKGKDAAAVAGTTCAILWKACPSRRVLLAEKPAPQTAQARRKVVLLETLCKQQCLRGARHAGLIKQQCLGGACAGRNASF